METNDHGRGNLERIVRKLGVRRIVELLRDRLSGSDLNTLLLELFRQKAGMSSPGDLLSRYRSNRFVQPAAVDPLRLKRLELELLSLAARYRFEPVELSPVAPLGACSAVAPVDQHKVISALRGTEVLSDATNMLALHSCDLIRSGKRDREEDLIRLCATHRHVRAQFFGGKPGLLPHFHLFCMVTSGKDTGSYRFETLSFWEHVRVYRDIFESVFAADMEIVISGRAGYTDPDGLVRRIVQEGEALTVPVSIKEPNMENRYYRGLQFTIRIRLGGSEINIGDGGFVDWPQQLLANRKERMLISAIGLERFLG
ncbi:hypothetical protein [Paenibacillus humicola]|uniref:hypothetical protein n=1 Tax=Paenibacillus humicola TaxID=3110540 RepID=UPI00237C4AB5|nr:hypothetical protein [Paenibacillus humicola]